MRARGFGWQRPLPGLVVGVAGVAAVTGVLWALQPVVPVSALAGLYVLAVLPVAVFWGVWPALIVAVVSALAFDFFFFPPRFGLSPTDPHIEAIVVISAVTSVVVSALAGRVRRRAGEAESLAREVRRIAEEQSALRGVATLVAGGAAPAEVFGSVAAEVGGLFGADVAVVFRFEPERTATVVGRWSVPGMAFPDGARLRVEGVGVTVTVLETGRPACTGRFEGPAGSTASCFAQLGARAGVGAPISVEGRLWGAVVAAATEPRRLPAGTEERLAGFTELVATAIANAQARLELRGFAEEQAALRRVATLVARAASPEEVFAAVAAEVRRVLAVDLTVLCRYDPDTVLTYVGWSQGGGEGPVGVRVPLGGRNVARLVFETGRPARIDDYGDASGPAADIVRPIGLRAAVGVPVSVEGRLWGVITVASMREQPPPAGTEERLAGFTELVATAIANAQARVELRGFAEEQAALRRVATLVARAAPPEEVFAAVTAEVGRLLPAGHINMLRYDPGVAATAVGAWGRTGDPPAFSVGTRVDLGGRNVTTRVFETGRSVRIDGYGDASGAIGEDARERGVRSAVGVPISVEGRLWGVMVAASGRAMLPADTEARLAGFTELVATAVANAEAGAALTASRARIVAAADAARRRVERDLHDGAQQRLVSLALHLRGTVTAAMPPGAGELTAELDSVAAELGGVLDELRELARGLHPAALADGGLRPALRTLARRSAVPVRLDVGVDGRLPEQVELAAYYVVAEALTNAAKHADASVVDVRVATGEGQLWVEIRDDGRGGADPTGGSGLVGLTDRIEALGGWLSVHSPPGVGTALEVVLPLTAPREPELPTPVPGRPDDTNTGADHLAEPAQPGPEQGN